MKLDSGRPAAVFHFHARKIKHEFDAAQHAGDFAAALHAILRVGGHQSRGQIVTIGLLDAVSRPGAFYCRAKVRGTMWLMLSLLAMAGTITGYFVRQYELVFFIAAPLLIVIYFLQWFDAARCGRESQHHMFLDPTMRKMVAALFAAAAILFQGAIFWQLQRNVIQLCYTPTPSMKPTVAPGDYFLVFKGRPFRRWDIVGVSVPPGGRYSGLDGLCKRIIGLPGETIELTGDGVTIDGKVVPTPAGAGPFLPVDTSHNLLGDSEPMSAAAGCWGKPITLGPDEYYLLGDNTLDSDDSRFWEAFPGRQPGECRRTRS